ncbi:hypothetical protein NIES4071_76090 [Calothrix sp. NIES-4071]|nr:hypothetical protein NIES4071_76090 [Calothrix sp. NIES-4071]BAZ61884.1 hypothetical protein NIES4105_76040 [Calothrix sp. NIES-4105]
MNEQKVFADFNNADSQGRLRLNCTGTIEDLARHKVWLKNGQNLILYSEDLEVDGVVEYSIEENIWVAVISWDDIRQKEDILVQDGNF